MPGRPSKVGYWLILILGVQDIMIDKELWLKIINSLLRTPSDFRTVPKIKREPLYFYADTDGVCIYIDNAHNGRPTCRISTKRKIRYNDFETVYSYYYRWAADEVGVRGVVRQKSRNTAYIFALIKHFTEIKE